MDPKASFKSEIDKIRNRIDEEHQYNSEACPICGAEEKSGHICSHCAKVLANRDPAD